MSKPKRPVTTRDLATYLQNMLATAVEEENPEDTVTTWSDELMAPVTVTRSKSVKGIQLTVSASEGEYSAPGRWTVLVTPLDVASI